MGVNIATGVGLKSYHDGINMSGRCKICNGWGSNYGLHSFLSNDSPGYDIDDICLGCFNGLSIHVCHPVASCFGTGATINHFSDEEWEEIKKRFQLDNANRIWKKQS